MSQALYLSHSVFTTITCSLFYYYLHLHRTLVLNSFSPKSHWQEVSGWDVNHGLTATAFLSLVCAAPLHTSSQTFLVNYFLLTLVWRPRNSTIEHIFCVRYRKSFSNSFFYYYYHYVLVSVYSLVVRQSFNVYNVPLHISSTSTGTIYSYHDILDSISCALLTSSWLFCSCTS